MSKKNRRSEPVLPEDVTLEPECVVVPSSLEEVERHLRAFITAFVVPQAQERWVEFLMEKRPRWDVATVTPSSSKIGRKAGEVLDHFAVDKRFCSRISPAERTSAHFAKLVGTKPGVYFHLQTPPCKRTALEADRAFVEDNSSALLSFEAGRKVLYFLHDDSVWLCEKRTAI